MAATLNSLLSHTSSYLQFLVFRSLLLSIFIISIMGNLKLSEAAAAAAGALLLLLFSLYVGTAGADTMVSGTVICDQCRDGEISSIDYPLFGAKVALACPRHDGVMATYEEGTTNWLGEYTIRLAGRRDLSHCQALVVGGPARCWSGNGTGQCLKLFNIERYSVDPLLAQPAQPMGFCVPPHPPVCALSTPPVAPPSTPPIHVPSPPPSVVSSLPPPSRPSGCSHAKWTLRKYRCYWKAVTPKTTVANAFGSIAARKYGTNMTLWEGLYGEGEVYRTLLREGITALLNSNYDVQFFYPTVEVMDRMNEALRGTSHRVLTIAMNFQRANSGSRHYGGAVCRFRSCR